MAFDPIVKWSGSKRSQAAEIVARMPREIDTYYEPFCGGCSVLFRLIHSHTVRVKKYVASDLNDGLICLWNTIKDNPDWLVDRYYDLWRDFNKSPKEELFNHRKEFFSSIRARYNNVNDAALFLFLMRTTINGMPRYNDKGEFNNSCHFTRSGIAPKELRWICRKWSAMLNQKGIEFFCQPYDSIEAKEGDFLYLDPPYFATKGMYYGGIDLESYFFWLRKQKCKWLMSFDGKAGDEDLTYDVPKDIYMHHEYLYSGNSSLRRVIGNNRHAVVYESLYANYIPEASRVPIMAQAMLF